MTRSHRFATLASFLIAAGLLPAAHAVEADFGVKLKAGTLSEEARDLGDPNTTSPTGEDEIRETYLDLQPQLLTQFSEDFAHFFRVQAFAPSGMVTQDEYGQTVEVETYGALREFWFEYGGFTSYPGEVLRLGLQRLREPDGLWYDRDIETARWIFDTTLFQFQMGAAKAFNAYRTDDIELPRSQQDRAYGFAGISTQWVPRNYVGVRGVYATDQGELPENGTQMRLLSTYQDSNGNTVNNWETAEKRDYAWIGGFIDNRFFEHERGPGLAYRAELMGLVGSSDEAVVDPATGQVTGTQAQDVNAVGADAGLRLRFASAFPLTLGGAYAFGQGGSDKEGSTTFRQTGLHSNRSRFTGTRTMINRFNEALQADLSNLRVVTAFLSLPLADFDMSLIGHKFSRDDATRTIYADGIDVRPDPANNSPDIGTGVDAVLSYHFDRVRKSYGGGDDGDTRSNVRVRASQFRPGEAFGEGLKDQTRIVLEGTWWF